MAQDAFNEGVVPGGLNNKADIKLLICYILKKMGGSMTRDFLTDVLSEYAVVNYFEVGEAVGELMKSGKILCVLENDAEKLCIAPSLIYDVTEIENNLPRTIRERTLAAALKVSQRDRIKEETVCEVKEVNDGYLISFRLKDSRAGELFGVELFVADEQQIALVKKNFYDKASKIYADVVSALTIE